jgi:hypothetical protein
MKKQKIKTGALTGIRNTLVILMIGALCPLVSCKKLIDVQAPYTSLNGANVYTTDATAASVLTNVYAQMSSFGIIQGLGENTSLCADELTLYNLNSAGLADLYRNSVTVNTTSLPYWNYFYQQIFITNNAIEGLNGGLGLTPALKTQLLGEAKFLRAFNYFYLVNLYGDVPLVISTDYKTSSLLVRTPKAQVYAQIVSDLTDAETELNNYYLKGDALTAYPIGAEERVRPTKWVAAALLARTYLYMGQYANAEIQATTVIGNTAYYNIAALNGAFLKNNKEAIWQLQPVLTGTQSNTFEGNLFVLPAAGPNNSANQVYLSNTVLNAFETGDQRKSNWVNSVTVSGTTYYYPYKYKIGAVTAPVQEYSTIFRLGEQYLIRAEAEAQQNKVSAAQSDLNIIRTRAGLPNTTASTTATLLTAIMRERQVELFTEYGHRWLDLKRTNTIDAVMGAPGNAAIVKGGTWNTNQQLYPIPQSELNTDPNLIQNSGY